MKKETKDDKAQDRELDEEDSRIWPEDYEKYLGDGVYSRS